jgi:molecular chaperone GrpE
LNHEENSKETTNETFNEKIEEITENEGLQKQFDELQKQLETYKDQLLRKAAEFENFKKRTENDYLNLTKFANEYLISDLLPVIDDFERSLNSGKEKPDFDSFYKGIELIYSKFMKILEGRGLKVIEALDKPFDVNYHEAMLVMPKDDVPPSTVVHEIEKGYLLHDKVIRHTKVAVSGQTESVKEAAKEGDKAGITENP